MGFTADARQDEGRFVPQPNLIAPEGFATFRGKSPAQRAEALQDIIETPQMGTALQHAAETAQQPLPDPQFAEPQAVMPRAAVPGAAQLAEARATAFAEGHAQGRAETLAELEQERAALTLQANTLTAAIECLTNPPAAELESLTVSLSRAVARLASERAGQAIDAAPAGLARRIAGLAEQVAQGMRDMEIHLNPDDLTALRPVLAAVGDSGLACLQSCRLVPNQSLSRGDAELRAPGVRILDQGMPPERTHLQRGEMP